MNPTKTHIAEITSGNASFSQSHPGVQLAWDTVSTGYMKECWRKYYLHIIEGWTPKRMSVHLYFGLIAHLCIETYHRERATGKSHDHALRLTVRKCLEESGKREVKFICQDCNHHNALPPALTEQITKNIEVSGSLRVENVGCVKCNSINITAKSIFIPWASDDKNKNRKTLLRTVVWYLDHYKDSDEKTVILPDGTPAVELWFRYEIDLKTPDGTPYILTGHLDRLIEIAGEIRFQDLKTTKSTINNQFFDKFNPDNQMSHYTAGGKIVFEKEIAGGLIDAAQVAIDFTRFQRGFVDRTPAQTEEWLKDIQIYLKMAEALAEATYWPMNDKSCWHFGGCPFVGVCNKDPTSREIFLKRDFERRQWDPLKKRGI